MPMCRRTSDIWKPDDGPSSLRPQLLTISNLDAEPVGDPDAGSRKAEPNDRRRELLRPFDSRPCFVKTVLRLLSRSR